MTSDFKKNTINQDGQGAILKTMRLTGRITTFLKEVKVELKKVNWPTRKETIKYTLIVIGVSFGVALFLGGLDFLFTFLISKFLL